MPLSTLPGQDSLEAIDDEQAVDMAKSIGILMRRSSKRECVLIRGGTIEAIEGKTATHEKSKSRF